MISYIHFPIIGLCAVILIAVWRLWVCIDRLNVMREVSRRAPSMFQGHLLAAILAIQTAPINAYLAVLMSAACIGGSLLLLKNSMEYLALSWAGSRVGALRAVAMLRIIDAAELAYALQYVHEHENQYGRVIDAETVREVSK